MQKLKMNRNEGRNSFGFRVSWSNVNSKDLPTILCLLLLISGVTLPVLGADQGHASSPAIRFSYPAVEDPTVTLGKYQRILDAMAAAVGHPVSVLLRNTYGEIVQDLERGEADVGILNTFSYVEIVSRAKLTPLVRRVQAGRDTYQSYLIVRENAGIRRYQDLRGKVIVFPDSRSTTGYMMPRLMLRRHHLDMNRDFARVLFVGSHDSTALAVANGTAHAGAVASYIYEGLDPAVQLKLDILDLSEPIPFGPIVARAALGGQLLESIRLFFVGLDRSPRGKTLLMDARLSGFTAATDSDYASIRELVRRLREVGP
jgi:phosphonate transport system substrate-binding protein